LKWPLRGKRFPTPALIQQIAVSRSDLRGQTADIMEGREGENSLVLSSVTDATIFMATTEYSATSRLTLPQCSFYLVCTVSAFF